MNVARKIGLFLRHAGISQENEPTNRNLSIKASTALEGKRRLTFGVYESILSGAWGRGGNIFRAACSRRHPVMRKRRCRHSHDRTQGNACTDAPLADTAF